MKLLTLLKALQPDEYKEFEKFLASPFFRASEQQLAYFKHLSKRHKGFEVGKAELEAAYRRCFGKDAYTDHKLYNLMSLMGKQVEDYFAVKAMMDDGRLQQSLLVRAMGQRKMGTHYRNEAEAFADAVEAQAIRSKEDYLLLEQLYTDLYFNPDTAKHKPYIPHLQKGMEQLDLYYSLSKLRYAAEMLLRERVLNEHHHIPVLDLVLHFTESLDLEDKHFLLALYNNLVRLYRHGVTEEGFRFLQALFIDKHGLLPKPEQTYILVHLINCGIALGRANVNVNQELLTLYKISIEAEAIMENGRITHLTFSNIVALAAVCGEIDWAMEFMGRFSPHLADDMRKPTVQLSMANIHYAKGDFNKAQNCLVQEVFMTPTFDIVARGLLMKILLDKYIKEGKDYEYLMGHLNAYEKFVEVKRLSEERKVANLNGIRFVRKMTNLKSKHACVPSRAKEHLKNNLSNLNPVIMKNWLQERIDML